MVPQSTEESPKTNKAGTGEELGFCDGDGDGVELGESDEARIEGELGSEGGTRLEIGEPREILPLLMCFE